MSLGMMNAILGRFVERGWIMLTNVNGRKLAYAVTAEGISELTARGKSLQFELLNLQMYIARRFVRNSWKQKLLGRK